MPGAVRQARLEPDEHRRGQARRSCEPRTRTGLSFKYNKKPLGGFKQENYIIDTHFQNFTLAALWKMGVPLLTAGTTLGHHHLHPFPTGLQSSEDGAGSVSFICDSLETNTEKQNLSLSELGVG